jgi:hypothetical protein
MKREIYWPDDYVLASEERQCSLVSQFPYKNKFQTISKTKTNLITSLMGIITPTSLAARSKDWVCGRSIVGIAGSIPARVMDVLLL